MALILIDAQDSEHPKKKEISENIDILSDLEETLIAWLDLQKKLKTLIAYFTKEENQEAHPDEYEKLKEAK